MIYNDNITVFPWLFNFLASLFVISPFTSSKILVQNADKPSADIPDLRPVLQNYLACGTKDNEAADFFALNVYEWCGVSTFDGSGYSMLQQNASDLNIPIFISETGCRIPRPRLFADQASILGKDMEDVWSGAIVYEWIEEENNYGLISYGIFPVSAHTLLLMWMTGPKVDPEKFPDALDGFPRSGTPTPISPDYNNLKSQWATLTPSGIKRSEYSATKKPPPCPTSTLSGWEVNGDVSLPTLGQVLERAAASSAASQASTATGATASASPSTTGKGVASVGREVAGMGIGLVGVMLGFTVWL